MIGRKRLITVGTITFLAGVLVMLPARVAYHAFAPDAVKLSGIGGSIWNGSATEGQIGALYISSLRWSFKPLSLLAGKLAFEASVDPADGFLEADVALGLSGRVTLTDVEGAVSIGALESVFPAPGLEGNVRFAFSRLTIRDGLPVSADGTVEVFGLVARGLSPTPIGDFKAELASSDGGISGSVEDLSGALAIAGSLKLSTDRSYSLTGLVAPTAQASDAVINQLRFLGSANERGQREFRFEGRL